MHVLILSDMEGISQITTYEELIPVWPEYWEQGRDKMTDDVLAAVDGLFAGGATKVTVHDGHGSGARNIVVERMPEGVAVVGFAEHDRLIREGEIDATFQVGRHARRGTDSFSSHTMVPYFAATFDGHPITESHFEAYRSGVPLLGITGDESLEGQIDQGLAGTPYLVVKHSRGRKEAVPAHPAPEASAAAIRDFARECMRNAASRPVPTMPTPFTFAASMPAEIAGNAVGQQGLQAEGPTIVSKVVADWWRDFEPAFLAAIFAGYPGLDDIPEADPDMQTKVANAAPERLEAARTMTIEWLDAQETHWD
jgi:D-amino peptidase